MTRAGSFIAGAWVDAGEPVATLLNPATEEPLGELLAAPAARLAAALPHARQRGGPALRAMSFAERAEMLRALSRAIHASRDKLIAVAMANGGNTRGDAKFDVDGASGTFAHYADLGAALGGARLLPDGDSLQLGRSPRWHGRHVSGR